MRKNIEKKKKKKKPPRPRGCRSRSRRPPGEARPVGSPPQKKIIFFWISITKPGISVCKSLKKKKFPPTPRLPMSLMGKPCSSPEESHRGRTPTPSAAKCRRPPGEARPVGSPHKNFFFFGFLSVSQGSQYVSAFKKKKFPDAEVADVAQGETVLVAGGVAPGSHPDTLRREVSFPRAARTLPLRGCQELSICQSLQHK